MYVEQVVAVDALGASLAHRRPVDGVPSVADSAAQLNSVLCALICVYLRLNTANFVSATLESSAKG